MVLKLVPSEVIAAVVIERVIRLFALNSSSTLRIGCATLGGGCIGDVVGFDVGDLFSTNLSNSRSSCLPLLLVIPFHASIQSAMACMVFSAWVIVGLVMRL